MDRQSELTVHELIDALLQSKSGCSPRVDRRPQKPGVFLIRMCRPWPSDIKATLGLRVQFQFPSASQLNNNYNYNCKKKTKLSKHEISISATRTTLANKMKLPSTHCRPLDSRAGSGCSKSPGGSGSGQVNSGRSFDYDDGANYDSGRCFLLSVCDPIYPRYDL
jgi:hypothetical protein